MKKNKLKVYSSKSYSMTPEDREKFEWNLQKEREKYERDLKSGGIDESGNYTALHYRWNEK